MSPIAHGKILAEVDAFAVQMVHFFNQGTGVHDDSVPDDAQGSTIENAGRDEMEDKRIPRN